MKKQSKLPLSDAVLTFRQIRQAIGYLAIGLPLALIGLPFIPLFKTSVQDSISYYYYTNLREVFTGTLCAVALFLIRYRSSENDVFWKDDDKMTNIAGIFALGVAIFPTNPVDCSEKIYTLIPFCVTYIGVLHFIFAAAFFFTLAEISIVIFTIGQKQNKNIPLRVMNENNIYILCGCIIIISVVMIGVCDLFSLFQHSTLIFETLALTAFGISWLIKGRAFGQTGKLGSTLYREKN